MSGDGTFLHLAPQARTTLGSDASSCYMLSCSTSFISIWPRCQLWISISYRIPCVSLALQFSFLPCLDLPMCRWLGQNSKQGKLGRQLGEMQIRMRLKVSGDKGEIRQSYLPAFYPFVVQPLIANGAVRTIHIRAASKF